MRKIKALEAIKMIKKSEEYKLLEELLKPFFSFGNKIKKSKISRAKERISKIKEIARMINELRRMLKEGEEQIFEELLEKELICFFALWPAVKNEFFF